MLVVSSRLCWRLTNAVHVVPACAAAEGAGDAGLVGDGLVVPAGAAAHQRRVVELLRQALHRRGSSSPEVGNIRRQQGQRELSASISGPLCGEHMKDKTSRTPGEDADECAGFAEKTPIDRQLCL